MVKCLSLCTRSRNTDYAEKGTCGKNFYQILRDTPEWSDIARLIETTMPTVLLLEDNLFVTGIPTKRIDKVGTPIRWSFHLRAESVGKYYDPLVKAFRNDQIERLGKDLDELCGAADDRESFTPPEDMETFTKLLSEDDGERGGDFRLWTTFCPTEREELGKFIEGLELPTGHIEIESIGKIPIKKKTMATSPKEILHLILLVIVLLTLLGMLYLYWSKEWELEKSLYQTKLNESLTKVWTGLKKDFKSPEQTGTPQGNLPVSEEKSKIPNPNQTDLKHRQQLKKKSAEALPRN